MAETITVPMELFRRMCQIVDDTVNVEYCLCHEMANGKCLYCRASVVQDQAVKILMRQILAEDLKHA